MVNGPTVTGFPPIYVHSMEDRRPVPPGMIGVASQQRYMMIAGRILVGGPRDLPAVWRLQHKIKLARWNGGIGTTAPPVTLQRPLIAKGSTIPLNLAYFEMLGNVLRDWSVTPEDASLVASFASIGLSTRDGFAPERLDTNTRERLVRGSIDGQATVRCKTLTLGESINGWAINLHGSEFGRDYLLRAAVAMDQIYVLPVDEALYPNARVDATGKDLDGRKTYLLSFKPTDIPPVDAFWSLTMYFAKGLMVPNPIKRYSMGDRTPGLVFNHDGGVDILVQHQTPRDGKTANWLPAPAGNFGNYILDKAYDAAH